MIRILLVDDQPIVCEGLRTMLNAHPNIEVMGVAHNGVQAIEIIHQQPPDLVLMDLKMPVLNGVEATRRLQMSHPELPVVILTTYDDDEWVLDAVRAGAAGYLLKDALPTDIVAAVEGTIAGRTHIDPAIGEKLFQFIQYGTPPQRQIFDELTEREREVLQLLSHGFTTGEIANRLSLAEGTVRNHVSSILTKLDVTDRAQATAMAWRHGLVTARDV